MKIKVINFGGQYPVRNYDNDSGADVFARVSTVIEPGRVRTVPCGIGLELPDGYDAVIHCKSGMSSRGIWAANAPIDAGYRGEINAILFNAGDTPYAIARGDKIGQIVIRPVEYAVFVETLKNNRAANGFGSTGDR